MKPSPLSAQRTPDPSKILWTVVYLNCGTMMPLCPEYTGITWRESRGLLIRLKATFPKARLSMQPHRDEHLTRNQAVKAVCQLFRQADRHDLIPLAVDASREQCITVLAPLAFRFQRDKAAEASLERTNERRAELGLNPVPRPASRPEPEITSRRGALVIHMGGAR